MILHYSTGILSCTASDKIAVYVNFFGVVMLPHNLPEVLIHCPTLCMYLMDLPDMVILLRKFLVASVIHRLLENVLGQAVKSAQSIRSRQPVSLSSETVFFYEVDTEPKVVTEILCLGD